MTEEPTSRRRERSEETRQELVAAAHAVFAEDGFHGASVNAIARRAGYSTGAIYWHFGGKDELFLAAFEGYALTRVMEVTEAHGAGTGPLPQRLRALADQWMARQSDPRFVVAAVEFFVHAWRKPDLRRALATRQAAVRLAVARILEHETRAASIELPLPAEELATVMRELGVGLALAQLLDPEAVRDGLFGDFVELFYELALDRAGTPE